MNRIEIDRERCKGCYLCLDACPKDAIETSAQLNSAGYYPACPVERGQCTACAMCARICPDAAITVYKEVKEKSA